MDLEVDFEMDMGSPWENVSRAEALAPPNEQVLSADALLKIPWDELLNDGASWETRLTDNDARSPASCDSLDWDAMFADEEYVVPGTNGMQVRRTIRAAKATKA